MNSPASLGLPRSTPAAIATHRTVLAAIATDKTSGGKYQLVYTRSPEGKFFFTINQTTVEFTRDEMVASLARVQGQASVDVRYVCGGLV